MPIYLEPPSYSPGGPDGKGWNRLSLNAHMGTAIAQCALRPRSRPALFVSLRNTVHAEFAGGYGPCAGDGVCLSCPIFNRDRTRLDTTEDMVLVRLRPRPTPDGGLFVQGLPDEPWVMSGREGFEDWGSPWAWDDLAALDGWRVGRTYRDEEGEGFWLVRIQSA